MIEVFSLFYDHTKGIFNTTPKKQITFKELQDIYNSDHVKKITSAITNAKTKEQKQDLKKRLPFITPYGTFKERNNNSINHFNSNIVAFDFDGLDKHKAIELKALISSIDSCLLCVISPRQKGVKALIRVNHNTTPSNLYDTLKFNAKHLCNSIGLSDYYQYCDKAQFVLCQPMFIAYDKTAYFNADAKVSKYKFIKYIPPIRPKQKITHTPPTATNRIEAYILRATKLLSSDLQTKEEGERHHSIIKVTAIAEWLHYAPGIHGEVRQQLLNSVIDMYGGEKEAQRNNAIKSFAQCFDHAHKKANNTIERIINEVKTVEL